MEELKAGKIRLSFRRFEDYGDYLVRSDMNTFYDGLRVFIYFCESDPVLSQITSQLKAAPGIDFDSWFDKAWSSAKGMAGSGELNLPVNHDHRMSIMYQILERVNKDQLSFNDFVTRFFVTGSSSINSYVNAFNDAIVEPLIKELSYKLEDLKMDMPKDDNEKYPLANIQIVHKATNVIQQSASGVDINQKALIAGNEELEQVFQELRGELRKLIEDKEQLDQELQLVDSAEKLASGGSTSLPAVKVILGSLSMAAEVGSIVSAIYTIIGSY